MWKLILQMSKALIVLLICVCVNECSNVNGHSEPMSVFLNANNGYRRTIRTGQYAGDLSHQYYESPSVLSFPTSLNDLQSNENDVRTITVKESSFMSFTTAATPTDMVTKWNSSEELPVPDEERRVAGGRNYGKQSYVVETIPSVFLPTNLSSVSLLINRILLSDEVPKPVPFSSYHSEEETMQTSDSMPSVPMKRPTINILKTVTSMLKVSNASMANTSTAPQSANKLKLFSSFVESTGNSPMSPTSTTSYHTATQSQPVPHDSPNEHLVASNTIGYGTSALSALYKNRQHDKNSATNFSKAAYSTTPYTPTISGGQMKYSPNPYNQQYSPQYTLTQPINSYENLQLTEEPEILTALPEFYSSINGLGASAPSAQDAAVGIMPSTSYSLPGFSSQVRKETMHFPKDANKNAASDLITGASTAPFSLPKDFTQVTNEYERHGKPKGIMNQFSKNTVSEMPSEMQQELDKYEFNYMVNDGVDTQFSHQEARNGNSTYGSYVVILPDGRKQVVDYEANNSGFYPKVRYEGSALKENENARRNSINTYRGFNQKFLYPYVSNLRYNRKLNRGYTSGSGTQNSAV